MTAETETGPEAEAGTEPAILSPRDLRFLRGAVAVILGTFAAATAWAVVSSPTWSSLRPAAPGPVVPTTAVRAPFPAGPSGTWAGEPLCQPDPTGDVTSSDAAEPRGGEGDLMAVCAEWGDRLVVEVTMDVAVPQQNDDLDLAELRLGLDTDGDRADDLVVRVRRSGEDTTAIVQDLEFVATPCPAAAAWRDTIVRVETDPDCIGEPPQVGLAVNLGHFAAAEPLFLRDDLTMTNAIVRSGHAPLVGDG